MLLYRLNMILQSAFMIRRYAVLLVIETRGKGEGEVGREKRRGWGGGRGYTVWVSREVLRLAP